MTRRDAPPRPPRGPDAAPRPGTVKAVTSLANPVVKEIRALAMRKRRTETGLFVAEGLKLLIDALEAGWTVTTVLATPAGRAGPAGERAVAAALATGALVLDVSEAVMASVTRRDNPQAVVAVVEQRLLGLDAVDAAGATVWVALEQVRDPGNLGTIIRTVDAAGASGVILVGETTDPYGIEAVRATMGSLFHVGLVRAGLDEFLAWRPRFAGPMIGTHLAATADLRRLDHREPAILVMGNEQAGLSERMAAACDSLAKLPMAGHADSLNLAVSTGIALFELRRERLRL